MKSTGIVRKMDRLGRIVIPKELRRVMNIKEDLDELEIFVESNNIILRKYEPCCILCNDADANMIVYKGRNICRKCLAELERSSEK